MGNGKSAIRTLPIPSGPYSVGVTDIIHDYGLNGIFFRLYYPIQKCDLLDHIPQLPLWIPRREYVDGYADFVKVPPPALRTAFYLGIGSIFIPAVKHAPLVGGNIAERFPVLLFSHGLGGNRSTYTTVCCDMASHGFIVAAVEHRDGSASYSYSLVESLSTAAGVEEVPVKYRHMKPGEKEFPIRNDQVNARVGECRKALDVLKSINNGEQIKNLMPESPDFHAFQNRMDFDRIAIMGHSFGGATVIAAVAAEPEYRVGVVLDGWMFPLHNEIYARVKQPLLFVNMEAFQWRDNIMRMKRLDSITIDRSMFTIRGSVHQSQTDFTFMLRGWLAQKFHANGTIDPILCNDINNQLCLAFLRKHLGLSTTTTVDDVVSQYKDSVIVGTNVIIDASPSAL